MAEKHKKKKGDKPAKMPGKQYESELRRLQAELCTLQAWVKAKGLRVIIVFEGRDGAGKGGTIRAITERQPARVSRCRTARSVRPGKESDVHAAVHGTFPSRRRDRDF
jgi:polyphosphate kinase 2 (PPK2 family)